ncbi:MAG: cysteine--tRNA ligase [Betaproteobacteria bacterium]|nr:cysteine--tRNA ligase [Betaproteobacteria bacterium]
MLTIYNSLTRQKQAFIPIEPGRVRMYVCGMTVYDYCHLGHARVLVVFDMVARWLRARGYGVTYVRNVTDIDDKIIRRAQENGESIHALTERFVGYMREDAAALGVLPPDHEPRATEYVPAMQRLIGLLQQKDLAYIADNHDVCYAVRRFPGYGKLSGKSLEDLRAGERVEVASGKHDPLDFVLWKQAKQGEPREARWDSPWGQGRPGWHIECSAMGSELLGPHFDIHGGGQDLQFPHHENEIAQSEGAHGGTFVNYWMHNGFVRVDDEKMSKSLGNFFTIRDVLSRFDAEVVRFFILRAHYRSPLNYSDVHLEDARHALARLYTALRNVPGRKSPVDWANIHAARFAQAMDDDFNTPEAIAAMFELANEVNRTRDPTLAGWLKSLGGMLGLVQTDPERWLKGVSGAQAGGDSGESDDPLLPQVGKTVGALIEERAAARRGRDFAAADRIRGLLLEAGIVLEDSAQGTTWRRA